MLRFTIDTIEIGLKPFTRVTDNETGMHVDIEHKPLACAKRYTVHNMWGRSVACKHKGAAIAKAQELLEARAKERKAEADKHEDGNKFKELAKELHKLSREAANEAEAETYFNAAEALECTSADVDPEKVVNRYRKLMRDTYESLAYNARGIADDIERKPSANGCMGFYDMREIEVLADYLADQAAIARAYRRIIADAAALMRN